MVLLRYREIDFDFANIFRVYISGSSGSGKTNFAKQLIESPLLNIRRVHYFHPDFHESNPNDWQETLSKDCWNNEQDSRHTINKQHPCSNMK